MPKREKVTEEMSLKKGRSCRTERVYALAKATAVSRQQLVN